MKQKKPLTDSLYQLLYNHQKTLCCKFPCSLFTFVRTVFFLHKWTNLSVYPQVFKIEYFQRQMKKDIQHCHVSLYSVFKLQVLSSHCFPAQSVLKRWWLAKLHRGHLNISKHMDACNRHFTPKSASGNQNHRGSEKDKKHSAMALIMERLHPVCRRGKHWLLWWWCFYHISDRLVW